MDITWSALIIDDDPGITQSIRLCLEADHARVLGVGTSSGALDALDRARFDVVFLDLWLGTDSGIELLTEILRRQPGAGVIVITAYATFESAVDAMRRGATDYLPKPFTPEQVRSAARRVVTANVLKPQHALRRRCVRLEVMNAAGPAIVWADAARLGSVLTNLLGNALKYSPAGGTVTVQITADAAELQIAMTDEGPGVPAAFRERVFEKFFRVEDHTGAAGDDVRGAGIGLYLCREIIRAHGGSIRCAPGEGGRGTRVAFTLPRPEA